MKKPRTDQNAELSMHPIAREARDLLDMCGCDTATMEQMQRVLSSSQLGSRRVFNNVEEVVAAARAAAVRRLQSKLHASPATVGGTLDAAAALGQAFLQFALDEPEFYAFILSITPSATAKSHSTQGVVGIRPSVDHYCNAFAVEGYGAEDAVEFARALSRGDDRAELRHVVFQIVYRATLPGDIVQNSKRRSSVRQPTASLASGRSRQSYHHGNLKAALVEAALQDVSKRGHEHLSLREIAGNLGVSVGAVYRHFAYRDLLLDAVAIEASRRAALRSQKASEYLAGPQRLKAIGMAYVEFASSEPFLFRLAFCRQVELQPGPAEALDMYHQLRFAVSHLRQAVGKPEDLGAVAFALSVAHGAASLASEGRWQGSDPRATVVIDEGVKRLLTDFC